jgi:hypothetical protein
MKKTWFAVPALLALAACESASDPAVVCPAMIYPAVSVTVLDSVSSVNVTPGSTLVLRHGASAVAADSVEVPMMTAVSWGVGGKAGTYGLSVRRPGYRSWNQGGIKVEEGQCGPETVSVTARLVPAS